MYERNTDPWSNINDIQRIYSSDDVTAADRLACPEIDRLMDIKEKADAFLELCEDDEFEDDLADEYEEEMLEELEECGFWDDESEELDEEAWEYALNVQMRKLKIGSETVAEIERIIDYEFANEYLLRQAFTCDEYAKENGCRGNLAELAFVGESVIGPVFSRLLTEHYMSVDIENSSSPFSSSINTEKLEEIRDRYTSSEYIEQRCNEIGLVKYLRKTADDKVRTDDIIKALIGAIAIDCRHDSVICEKAIDEIMGIHFSTEDEEDDKDSFDILNTWCMENYGELPKYKVFRTENGYYGKVTGFGFGGAANAVSRSKARSAAAKAALKNIKELN